MQEQQSSKTYHTLIHLGCGAKPRVEEYCEIAAKVCLIDADSEVVGILKESTENLDDVHVLHRLVDIEKREAIFYKYSLPWASGPNIVDDSIQRIYPGLRCLETTRQETTTLDELFSDCLPQEGATTKNLLLLDLGFQNEVLLNSLEEQAHLKRFDSIIVLPAHRQMAPLKVPPGLHEPEVQIDGLTLPEEQRLFRRHPSIEQKDYWQAKAVELGERHEQAQQRLVELEHKLEEHSEKEAGIRKQLDVANNSLDELRQALSGRTNELEEAKHQLDDRNRALEETRRQLAALEAELKERPENRTEVMKELEAKGRQIKQVVQERDQANQSLAEISTKRDEAETNAANVNKQLEQVKKERDEHAHWHQKNKEWANSLKEENEELKRNLKQKTDQLQEQTYRNQMLEREVFKLDAQVDLVTEVVFRSKEH